MPLNGQVALVAGASRGIGADIAKYLGQAGAKIAVGARTEEVRDPRLPGTIHSVTKEIVDAGGEAIPVVLNMRDTESIKAAVKKVVDQWGRLDILINNAAIFVPGSLETVQDRHIDLSLEVNVRSYILSMREVIPHMRAAGGGHIVNISSVGAIPLGPGPYTEDQQNRGGDIFYGGEKSMLEHFSQRQAAMLQRDNISVNILSPRGGVRTPGNRMASNDRENPDLNFEVADDMGQATVWICEQPANKYTGNILYDKDLLEQAGIPLKGPFR
ncbi:MAG: SDR family NAD(P)-dependent oxidoreductase [Chloroflexi bacterium]|nr:SDR family NAD(P)-dependent oxidoreductase [Chloroflexota bacterium]